MNFSNFPRPLRRAARLCCGTLMVAGTFSLFFQGKDADSYFEVAKNLDIFVSLFKELDGSYVDGIEPGRLMKVGIDAMLDELDPYTNYITESDIEDYEFQTTGRYGGVGATMRIKDNQLFVGDVYENSPAQKAGLHPGDAVLQIDNQPTTGKDLDQVGTLLKGSPGTSVSIKIRDVFSGEESTKMVQRGDIEVSSTPYAALVGPGQDVAYVVLTQFTPNCSRQLRAQLDSLKTVKPGLKGVVLDLRNNPGGLLDEAVKVCNLFVDRGELVVSTKGKIVEMDKEYKTESVAWDNEIPLAVLINHSSASASEIVSGTMQDLDRGVLIGERSYGKGLVQTTRPLGYNARLKLTTAKYYTPSGRCIQALDYAHRNADGSVGKIPDSLKKEYKTKGGRRVLSGGGVDPDVAMENPEISKLSIALYTKGYFFDYATQYVKGHKTIAPASEFSLTDAEWNAFAQWLEGKDYSYKTDTEVLLDSLQSQAQQEKYYDASKAEFAALRTRLGHDKKQDLAKNKAEVKRMLESEIVGRYYFQRGRAANALRGDDELDKALLVLADAGQYRKTLKK